MCESSCMALQFDSPSKFVFIGDAGGSITLLRLNGTEAQFVSKLSAHTGNVPARFIYCCSVYKSLRQFYLKIGHIC